MRVPGHTLLNEGAPFERLSKADAQDLVRTHWVTGSFRPRQVAGRWFRRVQQGSTGFGTGGPGIGVCSCGATSKVLPSGSARKNWHGDHKLAVLRSKSDEGV